jgi:hypothetical protein
MIFDSNSKSDPSIYLQEIEGRALSTLCNRVEYVIAGNRRWRCLSPKAAMLFKTPMERIP